MGTTIHAGKNGQELVIVGDSLGRIGGEGVWIGKGREEGKGTKRPPNAFLLYARAERLKRGLHLWGLSGAEMTRIMGQKWREERVEVRAAWGEEAALLYSRWQASVPSSDRRSCGGLR